MNTPLPQPQDLQQAQDSLNAVNRQPEHTEIKGRFNQYTSGFWALALPALAARYIFRYFDKMSNGYVTPDKLDKLPSRKYANIVGLGMIGITGLYATKTWGDMQRVFSETLGYEFDKKPQDVGVRDFFNSKNAIVNRTLWNFIKYNSRRAAVSSSFFVHFLPGKLFKAARETEADSVDLGVGLTGGYLVTDVLWRKMSFFEALQNFIDHKINHADSVGDVIADSDLMNLYAIHTRDNEKYGRAHRNHLVTDKMDTAAWREDQVIFGRMADLMNQTYRNVTNQERADFTVPKLIYLLGNDLIDRANVKQSLMYIEVANRYGIPAVKDVVKKAQAGEDMATALAQYPITLPSGAEKQAAEPMDMPQASNWLKARAIAQPAASYAEKTAKDPDASLSLA